MAFLLLNNNKNAILIKRIKTANIIGFLISGDTDYHQIITNS